MKTYKYVVEIQANDEASAKMQLFDLREIRESPRLTVSGPWVADIGDVVTGAGEDEVIPATGPRVPCELCRTRTADLDTDGVHRCQWCYGEVFGLSIHGLMRLAAKLKARWK